MCGSEKSGVDPGLGSWEVTRKFWKRGASRALTEKSGFCCIDLVPPQVYPGFSSPELGEFSMPCPVGWLRS